MKKLAVFSVIFTILAGAAFAQVTVKGGVSGEWIPFQSVSQPDNSGLGTGFSNGKLPNGDTSYAAMGFGRSGGEQQQGSFSLQGVSENKKAGFRYDLKFRLNGSDGVGMVMDSWGGVWFEPAPIFRADAGRFNITTLRGKVGSGWLNKYTTPAKGEGEIFSSFDGKDAALFTLKPVEGLWAGVMVNNMVDLDKSRETGYTTGNQDIWGPGKSNKALLKYALEDIQIGLGYTLAGIGQVRAQYVGAHPQVTSSKYDPKTDSWIANNPPAIDAQRIELAFAVTAVEGLTLDIGGKYWLPVKDSFLIVTPTAGTPNPGVSATATRPVYPGSSMSFGADEPSAKDKDTYQKPIQASLGAGYKLDPLTINGRIDGYFGGYMKDDSSNTKYDLGPEVWMYLWPTYNISEELIAELDVGLVYTGDLKSDGNVMQKGGLRYGFGASIRYNIAPGAYIRAGLAYGGGTINQGSTDDPKKLNSVFTIPVGFEVSF
jgi:hypothetical protein